MDFDETKQYESNNVGVLLGLTAIFIIVTFSYLFAFYSFGG